MYKPRQIYNLDNILQRAEEAKTFDGAAGLVLPQHLQHISTTIHEQKFHDLTFLSQSGIGVNNEGGYAEFVLKLKTKIEGDFGAAGNNSNSSNKISLSAQSASIPVKELDAESSYSDTDLAQAQMNNINVASKLIGAHNEKYNRKIDEFGFLGNSEFQTEGLLNYSGFATDVAAAYFDTLTATEMYDTIGDAISKQKAAVNFDAVFGANKIMMSSAVKNLLSTTVYDTANSTNRSVLKAIEDMQNVTIVSSPKAKGRMVVYSSFEQAMILRIPMPLKLSNMERRFDRTEFKSSFRIAGLDVHENQAGYILTGIEAV